ncbi:ATP-binding cassette domain-containing protein [Novosphingobium sp. BL-8H]|uniref:ATP-binding cassette domain-containing protein n=1 Tax=Novosphingobium sp. BL-8H TaxID=3127640 RepID=UPI003757E881
MIYVKTTVPWLADIAGAAILSWGLASGVGRIAGHVTGPLAASAAGPGPLLLPAAFMLGGATLRAGAAFAVDRNAVGTALAKGRERRRRLWPALLGGPLPGPLSTGESTTLAIDHNTAIANRDVRYSPVRLNAVIGPLVVAGIVAPASWVAAAIMLATLLPFVLGSILAGTAARRASERQLAALSALSGLFVDRVTHLPLIRHYGAEARISQQVREATRQVAQRTVAVLRAAFLSNAVLEFFAALSIALVAVYCGFSLPGLLPFRAPETLTLVPAFFVLAMAPEFYLPMRRLAAAYHEKQLGEAAEAALAPYTQQTTEAAEPAGSDFHGIEVIGLTLAFPGIAVGPLSFALARHDLVALTGPTGSGKTSTLAAIAGQLAPAAGRVVGLDGSPLPSTAIAWAAQRPLLVTGTLARNLALAAPNASDKQIHAVAEQVGLGPLLGRRGGLDMAVDHAGSGLSGGERRRIGLARAILSGRPLMLCDEPTADLDAASAAAMIALLQNLSQSRCILVATHDSTLAAAARQEIAL